MTAIPINKKLYNHLKKKIKARSKVWPSAYASGQLVRAYKARGGKYRSKFGSLDRWFKEKWVNVCEKGYPPCGKRKGKYPYCRPSKRVNANTPQTVCEISKKKLTMMCRKKKSHKKVFLKFGEKNNGDFQEYLMEKNQTCGFGFKDTCGFGRRKVRFGDNLGPTSSNLDKFYQPGTANSLHLNPSGCLSKFNAPLQRFGKKRFIQQAFKTFEKKGTKGAFTRWCRSQGYPKVTNACVVRGKRSKNALTRKRAVFAQNIRSKKRVYSFGNTLNKDIKYLKSL